MTSSLCARSFVCSFTISTPWSPDATPRTGASKQPSAHERGVARLPSLPQDPSGEKTGTDTGTVGKKSNDCNHLACRPPEPYCGSGEQPKTLSCRFFNGFRASAPETEYHNVGVCREKLHQKLHPARPACCYELGGSSFRPAGQPTSAGSGFLAAWGQFFAGCAFQHPVPAESRGSHRPAPVVRILSHVVRFAVTELAPAY